MISSLLLALSLSAAPTEITPVEFNLESTAYNELARRSKGRTIIDTDNSRRSKGRTIIDTDNSRRSKGRTIIDTDNSRRSKGRTIA